MKYATPGFLENMIKSIGCIFIQRLCLEVLITGDWITAKNSSRFSSSFITTLIDTTKTSIDLVIKRMCSEALYLFSKLRVYHEPIVKAAADMLIPQLSFKDIVSKVWAVKTLAHLCESSSVLATLNSNGIIAHALKCFLMTSNKKPEELDILDHTVRIMAPLSDFQELRQDMVQLDSGRGFQKLLDVYDRSIQTKNYNLVIQCIRIFIAFINAANKEGSGNANLKLVSEKRLYRLAEFALCENLKAASMVVELFLAYSQHNNVPIVDFWPHVIENLIEGTMCNGNYNIKIHQRDEVLKSILIILKKDYIHTQLRHRKIVELYLTIFLNSRSFSVLKFHASNALLFFCKHCM
jgi:hypothetical protein